ncbi:hypothetical protein IFR05_007923 [Cadophora sp. M221]|nr:hypothetical protein IFR05_007923 [Cadophora sp. M221]
MASMQPGEPVGDASKDGEKRVQANASRGLYTPAGPGVEPARSASRARHHPTDTEAASQYGFNKARPWTRYPSGYPRYSAFVAADEDKSTTIFRRFQRLSTRNLLYLESELSELEAEQDRLDLDAKRDEELVLSAQSWELLCMQAAGGCAMPFDDNTHEGLEKSERNSHLQEAAQERLHLALRIREVLTAYQTALKLEHDILALKSPNRRPLKGVRRIFYTSHNTPLPRKGSKGPVKGGAVGSGAGMISGKISAHLDPKNEQDLCVLAPHIEKDRLTRLFEGHLSYFFRIRTPDGLSDFVSHTKVALAVTILSGLVATLFLIGAMVGLYWVDDPRAKLGILSGLTVAFAGSLAMFTNARRQDVFASTAAYAAVLVVFISGNLKTTERGGTSTQSVSSSPIPPPLPSTRILGTTSATFITVVTTTAATNASGLSFPPSTPQPGPSSLSTGDKIGLGIGFGVGSLLFIFLVASCWVFFKRFRVPKRVPRTPAERSSA